MARQLHQKPSDELMSFSKLLLGKIREFTASTEPIGRRLSCHHRRRVDFLPGYATHGNGSHFSKTNE